VVARGARRRAREEVEMEKMKFGGEENGSDLKPGGHLLLSPFFFLNLPVIWIYTSYIYT
jgi:hypothetical protein